MAFKLKSHLVPAAITAAASFLALELPIPYTNIAPAYLGTWNGAQDNQNERPWGRNMSGMEEDISLRHGIFHLIWSREAKLQSKPTFDRDGTVVLVGEYQEQSGVKYQDMPVGTGDTVNNGQKVTINYEVYEKRNHKTSTKHNYGQTNGTAISLGKKQICEGLDKGIVGMRVNGIRRIFVPQVVS